MEVSVLIDDQRIVDFIRNKLADPKVPTGKIKSIMIFMW